MMIAIAFHVAGCLLVVLVSGRRLSTDPVGVPMPDVETQIENIKERYALATEAYPVDLSVHRKKTQIENIEKSYASPVAKGKKSIFPVDFFTPASAEGKAIVAKDDTNPKENTVKWSSFYGDVASKVLPGARVPGARKGQMPGCSKGQEACLNQACDDSGPFHVNAEYITRAIARVLQRINTNQRKQHTFMLNSPDRNACYAHSGCSKAAKENLSLLFKLKRFKDTGMRYDNDFMYKYNRLPFFLSPISMVNSEAQFKSEACGVEKSCENWVCSAVE